MRVNRWMSSSFNPLREQENGEGAPPGGGSGDGGQVQDTPVTQGSTTSVLTSAPSPSTDTGGSAADWRSTLPEDIREHKSIQQFKDVDSLVKSYIHQQPLIGGEKLPKPNDKWTPDQWDAFHKELGRPDKPDEYGISEELTEKFKDKVTFDENVIGEFRQKFHELGLTKAQGEKILNDYLEFDGARTLAAAEAQAQETEKALAEYKLQVGERGYNQAIESAQRVLSEFGDPSFYAYLEKSGAGNSPEMIQFLAKISASFAEGKFKGASGGFAVPTDADAAKAELRSLKNDPKFVASLFNPMDPGHEDAKNLHLELQKRIAGGETIPMS